MVNPQIDCSGTPNPCIQYPYCWHYRAAWWDDEEVPNPYTLPYGEGIWRENRQSKSRRLIAKLRDAWHPADHEDLHDLVSMIHSVYLDQSSIRHRVTSLRRRWNGSVTGQNMTQRSLTLKD